MLCPNMVSQPSTTAQHTPCNQELKRQQEEEEARLEEARLAAEQARLTAQFQNEQDAERGRANRRGSGAGDGELQGGCTSGSCLAGAGGELKTSKSEGRRRTSGENLGGGC